MKKRITIYDIAEKTGFSVGTVNRALSGKPRISPATKKLILETSRDLGYKANVAAQGLRRNLIKIGAILFCPVKEYSDSIIRGINSSADDLEKYNVTVDVTSIDFTSRNDCIKESLKKMQYYFDNNYDGIILFLSAEASELDEVIEMIAKFKENNIAVVTLANDILNSKRDLFVGIDAFTAGRLSAEILGLCCEKSDVAILTSSNDSQINSKYIEGFNNYAENGIFNSIKIYSHFDNPELVIRETDRMINENPELKGIYMTTASSEIACKRITELEKSDLKIITTDLLTGTPELLKSGIATATIFQNPFRQGRDALKQLYNYIISGEKSEYFLIPPILIFKSNVDNYET